MDLDVTSPKQLNRRLFLKQLAVDLSNTERRILFRAQYVSLPVSSNPSIFPLISSLATTLFSFVLLNLPITLLDYYACLSRKTITHFRLWMVSDTEEKIEGYEERRIESFNNIQWFQEVVQVSHSLQW